MIAFRNSMDYDSNVARITVEDCLKVISNRFLMTIVAILRARQLLAGDKPRIPEAEGHKPQVAALKEIAGNIVNVVTSDSHTKNPNQVLESVFKQA